MSIYKGLLVLFGYFLLGTGRSPFAHESFQRLESGENESNSNEEVVNVCCQRESHFETIGIDLDATQLRVDVGRCRQSCNALRPMQRSRFDRYLQKYPDVDPVKIFLALQGRTTQNRSSGEGEEDSLDLDGIDVSANWTSTSSHSCLKAKCVPTQTRRELHFGVGGSRHEVEVIESCDCEKTPASADCSRVPRQVRFHVDTPFETALDLGQCVGQCGQQGEKCRPVRNKTVHIQGPNGAQCLQAIEECSCNGECFRAKEYYKVFDFTNQTQTQSGPLLKMIDIGRCVGRSCSSPSSSEPTSKCLFWSESRRECVSHLYGGRSLPSPCAPTKTVTHFYTDRTGQRRSILSIMSCGCNNINN